MQRSVLSNPSPSSPLSSRSSFSSLWKLLPLFLCLTGCHQPMLSCRSEYLYPNYLASDRIQTPDPDRLYFYGQQLIVYWNLPRELLPADLHLTVRYGTRECAELHQHLTRPRGHTLYQLIEDDYWDTGGILSYKALLFHEGELLTDWYHHLWVDCMDLEAPEAFDRERQIP